jgi:S-formylglutathione hydrolase FrmB
MLLRGLLLGLVWALLTCASAQAQLTVTATQTLSPRLTQYTATSTALGRSTNIRVLLPDGYAGGARSYPVLLLLHGCCDDYRSWVDKGRAEQLTAGYPLIVVMPDGGSAGWYSDPYNAGAFGPPRYETYAFEELLPWVDATFRSTGERAVAGLSMGGFGALKYAARHPGVFQAAASYSGVMDAPSFAANGYANLIPNSVWGSRATDLARWREHNPLDLAANLRGLKLLELRTGNGQPGPLDTRTSRDNLEYEVWRENGALHARLDELGIAHVYDDYGPGVHDWPYWARGLQQTLRNLAVVFPATATGTVGGQVPVALSLQLGGAASFGTFVPATARTYTAAASATVTSTAGDATLSVSDPEGIGRLTNGAFALAQPVRVNGVTPPGALKTWNGPTTAEPVTLSFEQAIGASEALRSGAYTKTLVFTLSTATP